jgi:hypothetical protein
MSIRRRTFLQGGVLAVGSTLLPPDQTPLRPAARQRLTPGTVKPTGWLATQLDRQLHGLNGRYQEVSHYLQFADTGWTNPANVGGEEVGSWPTPNAGSTPSWPPRRPTATSARPASGPPSRTTPTSGRTCRCCTP